MESVSLTGIYICARILTKAEARLYGKSAVTHASDLPTHDTVVVIQAAIQLGINVAA